MGLLLTLEISPCTLTNTAKPTGRGTISTSTADVELGPTESDADETSSDADDELGRETATEGQPIAGGAGETGNPPVNPEPPAKVQKTAPRVRAQDRWAMVPMDEPDAEPFEGPTSSSGRPLRPSKRFAKLQRWQTYSV